MKKQKSIFIMCFVRDAHSAPSKKLEAYKKQKELEDYEVHLSNLYKANGYEICMQNMQAILAADEVHIFFDPSSYDSHFYLGITFLACHKNPNKIIKVIENGQVVDESGQIKMVFEKSFAQMIFGGKSNQNKI